jgi:MoxR-like ATPase
MKELKAHPEKAVRNIRAALEEIHRVIIGQDQIIRQFLWALFANGHTLIIGVPGLAKTLLIKTISEILDLSFSRIQFTPDLMPSDIIGTDVIEESRTGARTFRFIQGPIFAHVILGDEINRSPPKTQSALLQAMQEYQVTTGGKTYPLEQPFFVFATQNPIEQEGTYPLPEAQLDRFMFSLNIGYPGFEEEKTIVKQVPQRDAIKLKKVLGRQDILVIQNIIKEMPVSDFMVEYAIRLVRATRPGAESPKYVRDWVSWGAGPRASQYLIHAAKSKAFIEGKNSVSRQDIEEVAYPILQHRIITNYSAESDGINSRQIIERIINDVRHETEKRK